ncbi:MAG: glycosyltransferase [Chloroflexi bacterium]|nr:glycosyltransferase [Chloroflexota bacterium]
MNPPNLSVVVPAFNERNGVVSSLREIATALNGCDYEIILVDDGSTDDTLVQARQIEAENSRVRVVHYLPNHGKGYALKQGVAHSTGALVAFLDADSDLHPHQLLTFMDALDRAHADVVIGSKLHPDSKLEYPMVRRLVSRSYFFMVHFLFGLPIHDTQTGIKLFRREVLEQVLPNVRIEGFAFDLELLVGAHLFGYKIVEAPIVLNFDKTDRHPLRVLRASIDVAVDTWRVFYWTSFWNWLSPSWSTKFWIATLVLGLVAASVSIGHQLNNFALPSPLDRVVDLLLLRFLDRNIRDMILLIGGIGIMVTAVIQLNKQIVSAFGRKGRTDLVERKDQ